MPLCLFDKSKPCAPLTVNSFQRLRRGKVGRDTAATATTASEEEQVWKEKQEEEETRDEEKDDMAEVVAPHFGSLTREEIHAN